jgi:HD superfamily phosphodiesterase
MTGKLMTAEQIEERCTEAMKEFFGSDERRINHALTVLDYAKAIHSVEGGDSNVVLAAAILHDVGIPASEEKYGSIDGRYQEKEGPPIAREILDRIGMDAPATDHVCDIIADHHSAKHMDTTEFRVLWDADWLVNIPNWYEGADKEKLSEVVEKVFKTKKGLEIAREIFLGE